ncbi:unnamed protein product [Spodoptera exigua]|nr:unnamed protein product [Spodoptera exigua]
MVSRLRDFMAPGWNHKLTAALPNVCLTIVLIGTAEHVKKRVFVVVVVAGVSLASWPTCVHIRATACYPRNACVIASAILISAYQLSLQIMCLYIIHSNLARLP